LLSRLRFSTPIADGGFTEFLRYGVLPRTTGDRKDYTSETLFQDMTGSTRKCMTFVNTTGFKSFSTSAIFFLRTDRFIGTNASEMLEVAIFSFLIENR